MCQYVLSQDIAPPSARSLPLLWPSGFPLTSLHAAWGVCEWFDTTWMQKCCHYWGEPEQTSYQSMTQNLYTIIIIQCLRAFSFCMFSHTMWRHHWHCWLNCIICKSNVAIVTIIVSSGLPRYFLNALVIPSIALGHLVYQYFSVSSGKGSHTSEKMDHDLHRN